MDIKEITTPRERNFLPSDFKVDTWENLKIYFDKLLEFKIESQAHLVSWLSYRSELESVVSEDLGRRYISMTCYTDNEQHKQAFNYFIENIEPNIAPYTNQLNKKLAQNPFVHQLDSTADRIMVRKIQEDLDIFREENIPLITQIQSKQQEYGATCGAMTVTDEGKEYTMQQAGAKLQDIDRNVRERFYKKINERRLLDKPKLDVLFTELIQLRHKLALNAGFKNFRDYMFKAMHRFDYTPEDCFKFHEAIKATVVPLLNRLAQHRKDKLNVSTLRPWDMAVDPDNKPPLKPFEGGEDLLEKTIQCFDAMDPFLSDCLKVMKDMQHLDLVSRKAKAPGGYNYPLDEVGVPFIFMNAAGTMQDVVTMLHEGGHAVHSIVTKPLKLSEYRNLTSEIAELASMSMELMSMSHWDVYIDNADDLKRAKLHHLEHALETLPWVATIDKFQHWIYQNPDHSLEERSKQWNSIHSEFGLSGIDWSGLEMFKANIWQKQLHLFEVPFYYIEYGIAQLGAFGVWKNCKQDFRNGLTQYLNALKLGYTEPIGAVYETAGVPFDFSESNIRSIMSFVEEEMEALK